MKKSKILAAAVCTSMLATAVIGGTMAYFTDTDADRNVMTLGNVLIVQNETDRDGNAYEDRQDLFPFVPTGDTVTKDYEMTDTDGKSKVKIWKDSMNNEIDKFVSVTNGGTEDAYVRTILAFETVRSYELGSSDAWTDLHDHFFLINGDYDYLEGEDNKIDETDGYNHPIYGTKYPNFMYVTIDGTEYALAVKTYEEALTPESTTTSSLRQYALTNEAGNEVYDFFGEDYSIIALSQAVQTEGFTGAETALNAAFGEITPDNFLKWLEESQIKTEDISNVIPEF